MAAQVLYRKYQAYFYSILYPMGKGVLTEVLFFHSLTKNGTMAKVR